MHRNSAIVMLVGAALVFAAVPAGSAGEASTREQNRQWLEAYVDDWNPDAEATLYTGHDVKTVDAQDAKDALLDRLDAARADLGDLFDAPRSHGGSANHTAGDLFIIELNNGGPDCNQHGSGEGGHYDTLVAETGENGVTINYVYFGTWQYVGTATSAISTGENGHAIVLPFFKVGFDPVEIPDQHIYRDEVHYEGNSDFWCLEFAGSTFNLPFLRGTFGPVLEPIP